ncbi:MAG: hypothetical protein J6Q08_03280, partial [Bacteroidaceae bacterium]|nr:hypothetical protein [Bacteroidaceae bacterium]
MTNNNFSTFRHLMQMPKYIILCFAVFLSCNKSSQNNGFDITKHIECSLEDCIEEYAIYPLKSDIPINQIEFGMAFDSLSFYKSSNSKE